MADAALTTTCPYCAEEVLAAARLCKHCKSPLVPTIVEIGPATTTLAAEAAAPVPSSTPPPTDVVALGSDRLSDEASDARRETQEIQSQAVRNESSRSVLPKTSSVALRYRIAIIAFATTVAVVAGCSYAWHSRQHYSDPLVRARAALRSARQTRVSTIASATNRVSVAATSLTSATEAVPVAEAVLLGLRTADVTSFERADEQLSRYADFAAIAENQEGQGTLVCDNFRMQGVLTEYLCLREFLPGREGLMRTWDMLAPADALFRNLALCCASTVFNVSFQRAQALAATPGVAAYRDAKHAFRRAQERQVEAEREQAGAAENLPRVIAQFDELVRTSFARCRALSEAGHHSASDACGSSRLATASRARPPTPAAPTPSPAAPAVDTSVARSFVCSPDLGVLARSVLKVPTGVGVAELRVHAVEGGRCLAVAPGTAATTTQTLTTALGYTGAIPSWSPTAALPIARITVDRWTLLRTSPERSASVVVQMPGGSVGMAIIGDVDGHASVVEPGNDRSWTYVALSDHASGWISGRSLRAFSGCTPAFESLQQLAHAPSSADSFVLGTSSVRTAGGSSAAAWLIQRNNADGRSHLSVFVVAADCTPILVHSAEAAGWVADMQLVDAVSRGGPTLVIMGTHPGQVMDPAGTENWTVTALGAAAPAFARSIPTGSAAGRSRIDIETSLHRRPDAVTGYWPMRLKPSSGPQEFFSWSGGALTSESVGGVEFGEWHY